MPHRIFITSSSIFQEVFLLCSQAGGNTSSKTMPARTHTSTLSKTQGRKLPASELGFLTQRFDQLTKISLTEFWFEL